MDYFAAITKEQILGIEKFYNDFMSDDNALTEKGKYQEGFLNALQKLGISMVINNGQKKGGGRYVAVVKTQTPTIAAFFDMYRWHMEGLIRDAEYHLDASEQGWGKKLTDDEKKIYREGISHAVECKVKCQKLIESLEPCD